MIEIIELVSKLFPEATNEKLPTIPDDAPRLLVSIARRDFQTMAEKSSTKD